MNAEQAINQEYKGAKNFMTPDVIRIGNIRNRFAYEVSKGEGFNRETIWGVSVVEYKNGLTQRRTDLSQCCHSQKEIDEVLNAIETACIGMQYEL